MIAYNVTIKIDREAHEEWRGWMLFRHIPDVMATGKFLEYKMSRLLGQDERDGYTYTIQYFLEDMAALNDYQENFAPALQKEHHDMFKDKFVAFRTLMHVVSRSSIGK